MPEIPKTLLEEVDLKVTLELILKNAVRALGESVGVIATWEEAEHRFIANASYGLEQKVLVQLQPILTEAVPDLAGSKNSFDLLSRLYPNITLPLSDKGERQDPIIALPLQIGGKWLGLIYILRPLNTAPFSEMEQDILTDFAEQAAVSIQNAKLAHLLAEEKRRLESILKSSAEGIMTINADRRITGFNEAMEKLTGYSREKILGKECFRVLHIRDREGKNLCPEKCPFLIDFSKNRPTFEQQCIIRTKRGKDADVAMVYSIIRSPEGKPLNAVINVRDISRYRELENLRETFLSMIGHELQTPLSIIKGYASTLRRSDGNWDNNALRDGLRVIEEESDRLSRVMGKLLLASRISTGGTPLEKEPIQLASLANKVAHRFQAVSNFHTFETSFEPGFPAITADPQLIEEVITNLIDNAVKYSPGGGRITVSGKANSKQVEITISDEGVGIPASEIPHLFERFHRVDNEVTRKTQGVGLGLYICKSIIEANGGIIKVTSQLEKGSQFTITFPLQGEDYNKGL